MVDCTKLQILCNLDLLGAINSLNFYRFSGSFKELSPHIASVKNILENHASYLMSGKELSKLVAFVKGTQFDLVVPFLCIIFFLFFHLTELVLLACFFFCTGARPFQVPSRFWKNVNQWGFHALYRPI